MDGNDHKMDVDEDDAPAASAAMTGASGTGTGGAPAHATPPQGSAEQQQHGGEDMEMEEGDIINTLEVDSDRADNDSSLGSEISSYVSTNRPLRTYLQLSSSCLLEGCVYAHARFGR